MLKKLRKKFVFINMFFITVVLALVCIIICVTSYRRLLSNINHALQQTIDQKNNNIHSIPQIGGIPDAPPTSYIAVISVLVNSSGNILASFQDHASMSDEVLDAAVFEALSSDAAEGVLPDLNLYYLKSRTPEGLKIAFADTNYVYNSMKELFIFSFIIGVLSMIAFFFISLFFSKWALRPVERAWQQQHQFVADASHELKTPLTVILANNSILKAHENDTLFDQRKWIESTQVEASHMHKLIDDLLFLAKSDTAHSKKISADIDISEIVWRNMLQFEPIAFERNITLNCDIDSNITINGDITQIKQLITILLDNACKYAYEKGIVFIQLKKQQNNILLLVQNTGIPIPKKDLPHIFDRFYRSDKARTQEGGYGLGLAIAKSIVDSHKGKISVESSIEEGTSFSVQF
jgi:two-component system, OmpR family, sensor histidine kinase CiaH